ncbi:Hypothetical Protein FCC1311_020972 [Hondaea fermentalgiana]|uniref:Protein kinase domain-containing protein n=1 Tax=Hondaea fermentalgiana TaxID=2315210 RepID=A0A2R5G7V4_9STRA|nr:Hypothetical Protein FCC1311_020972 [Hondaea fermentalgiana]|eukprot:GBG25878.1 Hypothetical Protein FCC1311_020972 [Hondaea fermentalgiana]
MAATRPFAEILLDTPMEDAALVDKYNATRVKVMQLIEQDASDFFGDRPLPSSGAVSSQYSSRSRGGPAPQSGVQARLDLLPVNVLAWQDFEDEVGWDRFEQEAGFGDVPVSPVLFTTIYLDVDNLSEDNALDHLKFGFTVPALQFVMARRAVTSPNSWTPLEINCAAQASGIGHRVDMVWTQKVGDESERNRAGILLPNNPYRARFLVHEHKSPMKFPYGLDEDDLAQIAQSWMQDSNTSLDEAKETVKSAWELACEDLTEYWELGGSFANRESSVRFRYPIIQIYVEMLRSFCKYGVLSTTDKTWFLKIEADNILYISRMFRAEAAGRESVRYAYACMLRHSAVNSARLSLDEANLRAIFQTNILWLLIPRADTGGVNTVVKVMTPFKSTDETREAEFAFWNEMDVYLQLRSLWGAHVPWYLYGGRHIFNNLIVATTYAGESLHESLLTDDIRAKALAALTAVHEAGVAHRDVLLRNLCRRIQCDETTVVSTSWPTVPNLANGNNSGVATFDLQPN